MYQINQIRSGSVCLDVINQTWSPMYDLVNVFEVFLPQLLHYPNPADPLNGEAAALLLKEPEKFSQKVKGAILDFYYLFFFFFSHIPINYIIRICTKVCVTKCSTE